MVTEHNLRVCDRGAGQQMRAHAPTRERRPTTTQAVPRLPAPLCTRRTAPQSRGTDGALAPPIACKAGGALRPLGGCCEERCAARQRASAQALRGRRLRAGALGQREAAPPARRRLPAC